MKHIALKSYESKNDGAEKRKKMIFADFLEEKKAALPCSVGCRQL
jgi:hypothetical protein